MLFTKFTEFSFSFSSLPSLWLMLALCSTGFLLDEHRVDAMNSYRFAPMKKHFGMFLDSGNNAGRMGTGSADFFTQSFPSPGERRAAFERRDASASSNQEILTNSGAADATEETMAPSRIPRANNVKFARKNCFFSPLQCSFYYKSNSNFANMLIRGDE